MIIQWPTAEEWNTHVTSVHGPGNRALARCIGPIAAPPLGSCISGHSCPLTQTDPTAVSLHTPDHHETH